MYNNSYIGNMPSYNQNYIYPQRQEMPKIIYGSIDEAKAYIVSRFGIIGQNVFINRDKGELYIKSADNMGKSSMQGYKLTALDDEKPKLAEFDTSLFVTKEEFSQAIESLTKQIKGE